MSSTGCLIKSFSVPFIFFVVAAILFLLLIFNFVLNSAYIVERGTHPCGPLIKVGKVEVWKKVGRTNVSDLCFSCELRGTTPRCQTTSALKDEGRHLMTL